MDLLFAMTVIVSWAVDYLLEKEYPQGPANAATFGDYVKPRPKNKVSLAVSCLLVVRKFIAVYYAIRKCVC